MSLGFGFSLPAYTGAAASFGAGATLALDFTSGNQTLDPRITFTRATTATFTGSNGLIQTAAINAPRFNYNPTTLAPLGLLIEEQRTNLLTYSEQFDNASWTKVRSSITANTVVAPSGALTGDKLVENTDTNSHYVLQDFSQAGATTYTATVYAKAGERRWLRLVGSTTGNVDARSANFDLVLGVLGSLSNATATITPVGNGWYRCSITFTSNADATYRSSMWLLNDSQGASYTGDGYSGIYIWGAQLEAGAFPTSYIPTVASQGTRSADVAVMTGTNFSSWYNQAEGALYGEYANSVTPVSGVARRIASVSNGTDDNRIYIAWGETTSRALFVCTVNGVSQAAISGTAMSASGGEVAGAYKVNDFAVSANGFLTGTDTVGIIPSVNVLHIGTTATAVAGSAGSINHWLNGCVKKIAYYPRRLANSELRAITA
jgi:hypothetical protein